MDETTQRQVWQRVFAGPGEQPRDAMQPLILQAMEAMQAYRFLTGALQGTSRQIARRLYEGAQKTVACLNGMRVLSGDHSTKPKELPMPKAPVARVLEKSYHRARRAMAEYTAWSVEPEFGSVFRALAQREEVHCTLLAQLLGRQV